MPTVPSQHEARLDSLSRRVVGMLLQTVATAALLSILSGSASAADTATGTASFTVGTGKTGKVLDRYNAKVSATRPAKRSRNGGLVQIDAPVSSARIARTSVVRLRGGIRFSRGRRQVVFRKMELSVTSRRTVVTARVGKLKKRLFTAAGKPVIGPDGEKLSLSGAKLSVTREATVLIRKKLRLKSLPAGDFGRAFLDLRLTGGEAVLDPYFGQCGLAAVDKGIGFVPSAAPLPDLTGPQATAGEPVTWAFRNSLNAYVNGLGRIEGLDGASVNRSPAARPQEPPTGFTFGFSAGSLARNGPGVADDQAVLNGTGTIVYCAAFHGFRIAISNPAIVIDGASSRVIADVDTNILGNWTPAQRVDLAELDISSATATEPGASSVKWAGIPATLSQSGSDALRLCELSFFGAPPACLYRAGEALESLTVVADTGAG